MGLLSRQATRLVLLLAGLAAVAALLWWRGPNWGQAGHAFAVVRWWWVFAAVGMNLVSVVVRSLSWRTIVAEAERPSPRFRDVFSAFAVGLGANAVIPGRVGEVARIWVLKRKLRSRRGLWASLGGTVLAHRSLDLFPALALVVYVLFAARLPIWARTSLWVVLGLGAALFLVTLLSAKRVDGDIEGLSRLRALVAMGRQGLSVMRRPQSALLAAAFQFSGWASQLAAVYCALEAFNIHGPWAAAALVLVLINVATVFPLWPGNLGLTQAAIALPLRSYRVAYGHGFAFGLGLQAIEASVGISVGLIFLFREGLSLAQVREMESDEEEENGPEAGA